METASTQKLTLSKGVTEEVFFGSMKEENGKKRGAFRKVPWETKEVDVQRPYPEKVPGEKE